MTSNNTTSANTRGATGSLGYRSGGGAGRGSGGYRGVGPCGAFRAYSSAYGSLYSRYSFYSCCCVGTRSRGASKTH